MLNIVLMGPPGAGKGSLAKQIIKHYPIPHISTGDMFRDAIKSKTPLGVLAASYINDGHLVPDEVTIDLVKERLGQPDCANGYLLDGFPRTVVQAEALQEIGRQLNRPVNIVLDVDCDETELIRRITGRRVCRNCGAPYHIDTVKPLIDGKCDTCGGELYQRKDDTREALAVRLKHYYDQTLPVVEFYKKNDLLVSIDGSTNVSKTYEDAKSKFSEIE